MTVDYRVPRSSARGEDLAWDVVDRFWFELETPYEPDPRLFDLSPGQRAVYALLWTYREVGNGGLHQYFYNSTGYLLPETVEGAGLIGEEQLAGELRNAARLFGEPYPRDRDVRGVVLDQLPGPDDESWTRLDDATYPLLERVAEEELARFIELNPNEFFLPG